MTERWFLCSHSARTECRILASLDMVMSSLLLTVLALILYVLFWYPHLLQQYVDEDPDNRKDFAKLLTYGRSKQIFFISIPLLRAGVSLILGILLFVGAQKRSYIPVRIWFMIAVVYIVIDLILLVPRTVYTQDGKLYVIIYLCNFAYMVYELWAVFVLMGEVRKLREQRKKDVEADTEPVTEDTVIADIDDTVTPTSEKY